MHRKFFQSSHCKTGLGNWALLMGLSDFIAVNYSQKNILLLIDCVKKLLKNAVSQVVILCYHLNSASVLSTFFLPLLSLQEMLNALRT